MLEGGDKLELRQLQTFLIIVNHNNFTRAAEELGYAQSTVTTQIKKLEEHFGTQLFERIGRNIFLTEYGKKLLPIAKEMCQLNNKAKELISNADPIAGTLKIATPESLCVKWFPNIYQNLKSRYSSIDIELITYDCTEHLELLRSDSVDLAFVINRGIMNDELKTLAAWKMEMNLLISPSHPLVEKEEITYVDLNDQRFILTEKGCCYHDVIESVLDSNRIWPKEILSVKNIQVIKQLVMSGYGIGYLPEFAVNDEINDLRMVALKWNDTGVDFSTKLVCHREKWITPRIEAFIEIAQMMKDKMIVDDAKDN